MKLPPFKFKYNRVWRVYRGGKMIDFMREENEAVDGEYPEDWVSSTVTANNPQRNSTGEGISTALINGKEILFDELCKKYPKQLFGEEHVAHFGSSPGFLTKILDSAIRLPVQVHPDKETAAKFFNSKYGKTEAWIVLDTRSVNDEEPCLLFGFNENFDEDVFTREALDGNMTKSLSMLHKHPVKSGDILLVNGGIPHAIGAGVFLVEIMEPTDLVIQPELYCGSQSLTVEERFGEVSPEKALKVFQCQKLSKSQAWENAFIEPTVIDKTVNAELSLLIDRKEIKFFGAKKLIFSGEYLYQNTDNCCAAGIVCNGKLNIKYKNDYCLELKKGDTFFLPDQINDCIFSGSGELIFALPPVPESSKVNRIDKNGR